MSGRGVLVGKQSERALLGLVYLHTLGFSIRPVGLAAVARYTGAILLPDGGKQSFNLTEERIAREPSRVKGDKALAG